MVRVCCVVGCLAGMVADSVVKAADLPKPAVVQSPQLDWSGWYVGGVVVVAGGCTTGRLISDHVSRPNRPHRQIDLFKGTGSFFSKLGGYNVVLPSRLMLRRRGSDASVSQFDRWHFRRSVERRHRKLCRHRA